MDQIKMKIEKVVVCLSKIGVKSKIFIRRGIEKFSTVGWKDIQQQIKDRIGELARRILQIWESGRKGKAIISTSVLVLLLMFKSCFFGSASSSSAFDFQEKDFAKESSENDLFYTKGKDDGMKEVFPNLRKVPSVLKEEFLLCGSFNPHLDPEYHTNGWAYYNDADYPLGYYCKVVYVGDGWVVVEPNSPGMYGKYFGYIKTTDSYIEGQNLNPGFYAFVGTQKVPLASGSTRTMNAFEKIPAKANALAVEAIRHNIEAKVVAEEENQKRATKREYYAALPAIIDALDTREFNEKVHVPRERPELMKCIKLLSGDTVTYGINDSKINLTEINKAIKRRDVDYFYDFLEKMGGTPKSFEYEFKKAKISIMVQEIPSPYKMERVSEGFHDGMGIVGRHDVEYNCEYYFYEDLPEFEKALEDFSPNPFLKLWHEKYKK